MNNVDDISIGVIYDNQELLNPIFKKLIDHQINYQKIDPYNITIGEVVEERTDFDLVYNDLGSPSYQYKSESTFRTVIEYVKSIELRFGPAASRKIINGSVASEILFSKVRQLALFRANGVETPRSAITTARNITSVVHHFKFPIVIKDAFNHSDSFFLRIDTPEELLERIMGNFFIADESMLLIVQEWIDFKSESLTMVDTINGEIVNATQYKISVHPDYTRPFLTAGTPVRLPNDAFESIRNITRQGLLEIATIELGINRVNNRTIFLGIHPHSMNYGNRDEVSGHLSELTVRYIERRLSKIREMSLLM